MAYLVLARKYRPQTFDEVVGQEHITRTLKNALESKRIAHAYLFSGQRGTGKTSVARILSKALNCTESKDGNPCNKCDSCAEIMEGNSPDVIEIDGASTTGIDNIRDLIENSRFMPVKNKVKVYIIDEVHRISKNAFDALLKTLEEPSEHVYFMFATTEITAVPLTIGSRCQKFTFRKLSTQEIAAALAAILNKEDIKVEQKVLNLIARNSDGALRDAESILDQLISFSGGNITLKQAEELLETVNRNTIISFAASLLEGRTEDALKLIDEASKTGFDEFLFVRHLSSYFRDLLVVKVTKEPGSLLDILGEDELLVLKEQAGNISKTKLFNIIRVMIQLLEDLKFASYKRVILEAAAVKICGADEMLDLNELLSRVDSIPSVPLPVSAGKKPEKEPAEAGDNNIEDLSNSAISISDIEEVDKLSDSGTDNLAIVRKNWNVFVEAVREKKKLAAGVLLSASPVEQSGGVLKLRVKDDYSKASLESEQIQIILKETFKSIFKKDVKILVEMSKAAVTEPAGGQRSAAPVKEQPVEPIVNAANKLFGGRVLRKDEHGKL